MTTGIWVSGYVRIFHSNDKRMTFIPSVGFVYASLDEDHEIQFRNATSGVDFNFINENVDTWYLGPTLGAQLHFQASEQISLQIGGTAWLTYAESDYDGNQQFLSVPGSAIASDDSSEFAFRGTASASATYDTGSVMFSVVGGIDYWDYAPVIIHPAPRWVLILMPFHQQRLHTLNLIP